MGTNLTDTTKGNYLTTETDWQKSYDNLEFHDQENHTVSELLRKFVPKGDGKQAIEIGSYPGSFLPTIGRLGYTLNGIDFNPDNVTKLPAWLTSEGCKVDKFYVDDFFSFAQDSGVKYDLVCSFGFIEHFKNFEEVIHCHTEFVAPGGQLVITTPNFRGFLQYAPRLIFDYKNLKKHYIPSMQPSLWKEQLVNLGFDVEYVAFCGGYTFWVDRSAHRSKISKILLRITELIIYQFKKIFLKLHLESGIFSSYCVIVAKKRI